MSGHIYGNLFTVGPDPSAWISLYQPQPAFGNALYNQIQNQDYESNVVSLTQAGGSLRDHAQVWVEKIEKDSRESFSRFFDETVPRLRRFDPDPDVLKENEKESKEKAERNYRELLDQKILPRFPSLPPMPGQLYSSALSIYEQDKQGRPSFLSKQETFDWQSNVPDIKAFIEDQREAQTILDEYVKDNDLKGAENLIADAHRRGLYFLDESQYRKLKIQSEEQSSDPTLINATPSGDVQFKKKRKNRPGRSSSKRRAALREQGLKPIPLEIGSPTSSSSKKEKEEKVKGEDQEPYVFEEF